LWARSLSDIDGQGSENSGAGDSDDGARFNAVMLLDEAGQLEIADLGGKAVFGWAFVSGDCVAATDDAGHESLVIRHNRMLRSCSHQE
jgi:hypothetical protein